eukprot:TRINITY_DN45013_c0_g1_i1.p1 TRINITY_DN45013_c0_g1~~TRINITY_DN45013_c0_g1_i1.p1  ORF type:complete len:452 (-),score=96.26 TRINITY_DN45013_c0_g1_i1:76-1335(-)
MAAGTAPTSKQPQRREPAEVKALLTEAFGDEYGKTGHDLAGHVVIGEADIAGLLDKGHHSSLLYGELLPEGVTMLEDALFSGRPESAIAGGQVLELGCGTGKVALQMFLSLRRDVYGVELAHSRWELARDAMHKLAVAAPERFRLEVIADDNVRLVDLDGGGVCNIVSGSLLETPEALLAEAVCVVMEVCLPAEAQRAAGRLLQLCPSGCRVVCYAGIHGLAEDCRLAPVRRAYGGGASTPADVAAASPLPGDGAGGLTLPASWKPHGHGFAFYELVDTSEAAAAVWAAAAADSFAERVKVDPTGNPSRSRPMKYTDNLLSSPRKTYPWGKGDKVLVGYSWLPFPDLGEPGDSSDGATAGLDGVTWTSAWIVAVDQDGFVTTCDEDGVVEDGVHPERVRKIGAVPARREALLYAEETGA